MELFINDVAIDAQLENETTIGEVFAAVAQWLAGNGHSIEAVRVDGAAVDCGATDWHALPLDGRTRIEITAESRLEREVNALETVRTYAELLLRVLRNGSDQQLTDVLDEYPNVEPTIAAVTAEGAADMAEALDTDGVGLNRDRATAATERLLRVIEGRLRELLEPLRELEATATVLAPILEQLEAVPLQLQTGADRAAIATISRFSELAAKLARLVAVLQAGNPQIAELDVAGAPLHAATGANNAILQDLLEAFDRHDYVYVGDLLEYEIVPRYRALIHALTAHVA